MNTIVTSEMTRCGEGLATTLVLAGVLASWLRRWWWRLMVAWDVVWERQDGRKGDGRRREW
jgi:hypothetical protein